MACTVYDVCEVETVASLGGRGLLWALAAAVLFASARTPAASVAAACGSVYALSGLCIKHNGVERVILDWWDAMLSREELSAACGILLC